MPEEVHSKWEIIIVWARFNHVLVSKCLTKSYCGLGYKYGSNGAHINQKFVSHVVNDKTSFEAFNLR
jgi:hypothetical protein